jgi:hypothetical protein
MKRESRPPVGIAGAGADTGIGVGTGAAGSGRSGAGIARTTPATAGCSGSSLGRSICGRGVGATGVVRW